MVKRKTKDEKLQEQLDMLAKYKKNGGVHDRLLGTSSNNSVHVDVRKR
jgi:hypothetical protein